MFESYSGSLDELGSKFRNIRENLKYLSYDDLDIEKLRILLKINKWIVFGGSWGSSLSLAYSQEYPKNIISIVLRGVFLCREKEIKWFLSGMKNIFPDYWNRFSSFLPIEEREDLLTVWMILV